MMPFNTSNILKAEWKNVYGLEHDDKIFIFCFQTEIIIYYYGSF